MAYENGRGILAANGEGFTIPIPQDGQQYLVVAEVEALEAWTGTIQLQADGAQIAATAIASSGATAADPTAAGNYAADCGANAEEVGVAVTAYTAGTLAVRLVLIPQQ